MDKYLVAYTTGLGNINSTIVEVPSDYDASSDNLLCIKKQVVDTCKPRWETLRMYCSYNIGTEDGAPIKPEELVIINFQKLNNNN